MTTYQNVAHGRDSAVFINMENYRDEITFKAKEVNPRVGEHSVRMVKSTTALRAPTDHVICGTDCSVEVFQTAKIELSFLAGEDPSSLITEVIRLLNKARNTYALDHGLVPPVSATLDD